MVVEHNLDRAVPGEPVVASIDSDGTTAEYVIADISADGAWLSMAVEEAADLRAWC